MEQRLYARYFIGLLLFGVVLSAFSTFRLMVFPLVLATLLTVLLVPLWNKLNKLGCSKNISAFISVALVVIGVIVLVYILAIPLLTSAKGFLVSLPTLIMGLQNRLGLTKIFYTLGVQNAVADAARQGIAGVLNVESAVRLLAGTVKWLYLLFLTPVFTFYLLRDRREVQKSITYIVPTDAKGQVGRLFNEIKVGITTYVYGYFFISLLCMALSMIAYAVVGLESFLFLSFFMGACSFVPFVGPFIGGIPAIIVASSYGWKLWYVVLVILFIFQITGSVLTPKTIGNSVNVHPIFGILAMMLGYGLFGVVGILLAVPIFVVVRPIVKHIFSIIVANGL